MDRRLKASTDYAEFSQMPNSGRADCLLCWTYRTVNVLHENRPAKWGNSLALRIPGAVARQIAVGEGHAVDLQVTKGRLVVAPVTKKRYELSHLVSGINAKNRHPEVPTRKARGKEAW